MSQLNLNAKKIYDSQNRLKTLAMGQHSFVYVTNYYFDYIKQKKTKENKDKKIIFFGLGYNAHFDTNNFCDDAKEIYFHEFQGFEKACEKNQVQINIPENYIRLSYDELLSILKNEEDFSNLQIIIYKQNTALFPKYWYKLLAELEEICYEKFTKNFNDFTQSKILNNQRSIFIAGSEQDLMFLELCKAVCELNFEALTYHDFNYNEKTLLNKQDLGKTQKLWQEYYLLLSCILRQKRPLAFLSINGRNLDSFGQVYALLKQLNIIPIIWIADNPWNILSAFKDDWWKECQIYLTDCSFMDSLKEHGAKNVKYLPLAANNLNFQREEIKPLELLYVGHSAFKDKDKFFSAKEMDFELLEKAKKQILACLNNIDTTIENNIINFNELKNIIFKNNNINLWQNNDFRKIGLITTELDFFHKAQWLNSLSQKLSLIGDRGWEKVLKPILEYIEPVDYYKKLQNYYKHAKFTLNITSLLMPEALTQRHFDVWFAKGFLFTTKSAGLKIFQPDLVSEILVTNPIQLESKINDFNQNKKIYQEIKSEFYEVITQEHLYIDRLKYIITHC